MVPVPHASSSPRGAPSADGNAASSPMPAIQAAPVLWQPQADDDVRRFFNAAAGGQPGQPAGPQPARMPAVLSQAWSALPPDTQD